MNQTSIRDAWKLYGNSLNYPLYLPALGARVEGLLIQGDLQGFYRELRRLAALGSTSASSLIGYLYLRGAFRGGPRPDLAEAHSIEGARNGDAYSQYVLGWACFKSNRPVDATNWLLKSATFGLFMPAAVDVAVWMAAGSGFKAPDARAALKTLWSAQKNGHCLAIAYIVQILLSGRFGFFGRVFAVLLLPLLVIWGAWATLRWPLSARAFVTPARPRMRLLKSQIDADEV
jgi:hypothetical protein